MGSDDIPFDEAWAAPGEPRPHYRAMLEALDSVDLGELHANLSGRLSSAGVTFGEDTFAVDPIPRLLTADEWEHLERGLAQRARALNHFVHDAYGDQKIVAAGLIERQVIEEAEGFEPDLAGHLPRHPWPAAIIGFDVVRDSTGEFLVLEDNLRTPSGFSYAIAARSALVAVLPKQVPLPRPIEPVTWALLHSVMQAASPRAESPQIVVLTDGPENVAYYEHARAAQALDAILATPDDLVLAGSELRVRQADGPLTRVDVVYRRTNEDRMCDEQGQLTTVAAKLVEPWLAGSIGLVNAFGTGIADDKLVHGHVEDFIRFYLSENPVLRSVPTTAVVTEMDGILGRLDDLVVKRRHSSGGVGVVIGPHARADDLERLTDDLRENPAEYIAQPMVMLSHHPTVIDGKLQPRHVDLRPFSFAGQEVLLMPGGLSRVAFGEGALVVNSAQDGGGKDTWVMARDAGG